MIGYSSYQDPRLSPPEDPYADLAEIEMQIGFLTDQQNAIGDVLDHVESAIERTKTCVDLGLDYGPYQETLKRYHQRLTADLAAIEDEARDLIDMIEKEDAKIW